MAIKILDINTETYSRHMIHGERRDWAETNCYMDVWIELLHAMKYEPVAALPCTFTIDFEGDQWTFFKFPLVDLDRLYGLDVQELNIWHDLLGCIEEQLSRGRHVLVELDSFFLPDTQGTAYKIDHVKSTVAVNKIDRENMIMEYFHNQGYHRLEGDDFSALFLDELNDRVLPPYVEFVKQRKQHKLEGAQLLEVSLECFRKQIEYIPELNPFIGFKSRFEEDFKDLQVVDIEYFHKYSFATLRQYGVCFELCKTYLQWLRQQANFAGIDIAIDAYAEISSSTKVFQFQLARSVARKKQLDLSPLDIMSNNWLTAVDVIKNLF